MLFSAEDLPEGDLEWALRDQADGIAVDSSPDGALIITLESGQPSPQLARKLRNLFSTKALIAAERDLLNENPDVRAIAVRFIEDRRNAQHRWCMNPTCLQYLGTPAKGKRGRKPLYCTDACQAAAGTRRYRDKNDPGRPDRLHDGFALPRYVRPGYSGPAGNRRKGASVFGFDSIITPEIQAARHRAAVQGDAGAQSALLERLGDGEWMRIKSRQAPSRPRNYERQIALEILSEYED